MVNLFDLGCHKGAYIDSFIIYAREHDIEDYCIYAIEPKHENWLNLVSMYKEHDNVRLFKYAIANKNGIAHLYGNDEYAGDSIMMMKKGNKKAYELIDTICFSSFINKFCPDWKNAINLMKFSIEGAELMLLRDMTRNGIYEYFRLFYGSWNALQKMGQYSNNMVHEFFDLLKKYSIKFYDCNDNNFYIVLDEVLNGKRI